VKKNWPIDPKIGCSKPSNLVGACKTKSNFPEKLDVEFEEEVEWEDLCNFPNWFPIYYFECSLDPHTMDIFVVFYFELCIFFYHIVFSSFTLDYSCHSCKVYVGLAKEKSLNCICYFLVLLLKLQTSNL
jgi:hypothetical protein